MMLGEVVVFGVLGFVAVFAALFAVAYLVTEFSWGNVVGTTALLGAVGVIGLAIWAIVHA